jgi:hypothetical protein
VGLGAVSAWRDAQPGPVCKDLRKIQSTLRAHLPHSLTAEQPLL